MEPLPMKTNKTWVLIADGARARLVAAEGHGKGLQLIEKLEFSADHSPNRELLHDKPARVFESHGATRHGVEPKSDPHRELKRDFAQELSSVLDTNLSKHEFDKLVVVASPVTLGDLRRALSEAVKATVVAEVSKDLTKVPNHEIARHIEDLIPL
jgi:protein required for attachment to host cells